MWIVELEFTGEPERMAARGAHRQLLTEMHEQGIVRQAGPFGDDSGALIVFDVPDQAKLNEIMSRDPYFSTTGVVIKQVREWRPFLA